MSRRKSPEVLIAAVTLAIAACWLPIRMRFPFDDTYITFRYVANLAHGFGIVWNPGGPHTEGYTNFLFMVLLAPFSAMGWDLVAVSQSIGVIAVVVSAIAIYRIVALVTMGQVGSMGANDPKRRIAAISIVGWFAVALFLLDPFTWFNAFSGMETSLFTMWLVVALWAVSSRRVTWAFVFAMLATLTRPEGALMGLILLCVALWEARRNPTRHSYGIIRNFLLVFVLPLAIYAAWKYWYFGDLLPNSFYVKVSQASKLFAGRGLLRIFYTRLWYLVLPAFVAVWKGRNDPTVRVTALWCLLVSIFYLFAQVLMSIFDRYMNAVEVMLIVLTAISLFHLQWRARYAVPLGVAFVILHIVYGLTVREGLGMIQHDTDYVDRYARMATVFRTIPHHESILLASADAGILPYYSGVRHIDIVGLNTNEIAHARTAEAVVRFVAASRPDMIFLQLDPVGAVWPDSLRRYPINDSCRHMIVWGHGLIGRAFPLLVAQPELQTYRAIATVPQVVYDLDIIVDTLSPHYRDIVNTIVPRIGKDPDYKPPVRCVW